MGLRIFLYTKLYEQDAEFAEQMYKMIEEAEKEGEEQMKDAASSGFPSDSDDDTVLPYIPETEPTDHPTKPFGDILDSPLG